MNKVLKVLKINLLALIAIPLLLLATAFKLIAKAFEKITLFLILLVVAAVTCALLYAFASSPSGFLEAVIMIVILAVIGGLFFLILFWVCSIMAGLATAAWTLLISVINTMYDILYSAYLHLFTACEGDYKILSLNGKRVPNAICCLFFTLLRGLSWLIGTIVSIAFPLGIVASAFLAVSPIISLHHRTKEAFGMGIFQFFGKCSTGSLITGILIYLIFTGITVVAIMAMSLEWLEWGQELKLTDQEISGEIDKLIDSRLRIASSTTEQVEKNMNYINKVQEHIDQLDALGEKVTELLDKKDNPLLRSYWGVYMRNLTPIVEACSKEKGITNEQFKQLIPQIQLLDKQRGDVQSLLDKMEKELANPAGTSTFFVGCDTPEKLEKRYKSLCKTYHPDMAEGDTTTFQKMKAEYETIKAALGPAQAK